MDAIKKESIDFPGGNILIIHDPNYHREVSDFKDQTPLSTQHIKIDTLAKKSKRSIISKRSGAS
jgi:hypothetical protein